MRNHSFGRECGSSSHGGEHAMPQLPTLPGAASSALLSGSLRRKITLSSPISDEVPISVVVRAAWAVLLSFYTASVDLAFEELLSELPPCTDSGILIPGVHDAITHFQFSLERTLTVHELLLGSKIRRSSTSTVEHCSTQQQSKSPQGGFSASKIRTLIASRPTLQLSRQDLHKWANTHNSHNQHAIVTAYEHSGDHIIIDFLYDPATINVTEIQRTSAQFEHVLRQICDLNNANSAIQDVQWMSPTDLQDVWTWNATVPDSLEACVHEMISQTAQLYPNHLAVDAWDEKITYLELDELSSQLAHQLVRYGVQRGDLVPLLFPKSAWVPISILGVIKAGAATVLLDVLQPEGRLRSVLQQTKSPLILCSASSATLAASITDIPAIVVNGDTVQPAAHDSPHDNSPRFLPRVDPSDKLYVAFTSGSTGAPKGAIISHSNFASAVRHQHSAVRLRPTSRVYDFASYAFDVAYSNCLHTLVAGGCLCIPSEYERQNDLAKSMSDLQINHVELTPSIAALIEKSYMPKLDVLMFGGEALDPDLIPGITVPQYIYNSYGPAECTITSIGIEVRPGDPSTYRIGKGIGATTWVADTETGNLVPVGAVGELLIEGPLVGQGYLNDSARTSASFIRDPQWLLDGCSNHTGRGGRLYRTGDLVRYESDGSLSFIGRKDEQVKINGQRVELGEIEFHIRQLLSDQPSIQVIVDVITTSDSSVQLLTAFISNVSTESGESEIAIADISKSVPEILGQSLPDYMIPRLYFPVVEIPISITGKTDRKALRKLCSSLTSAQLLGVGDADTPDRPATAVERQLQELWASTLRISPSARIGLNDNFLHLGGNSLLAIQLVTAARKQDLLFSVADVFRTPKLSELAQSATVGSLVTKTIPPFALLSLTPELAREHAAVVCVGVRENDIEDIYPCTPLQEGLLAMTAKRSDDFMYISQTVLEVHPSTDVNRLCQSWHRVVADTPTLRTRIADLPNQGLVHVIVIGKVAWHVGSSVAQYCAEQKQRIQQQLIMCMGAPLMELGLVHENDKTFLIWTQHHATYDGWSQALIQEAVERAYLEQDYTPLAPFQPFIKFIRESDETSATNFWTNQFSGIDVQQFPSLPPSYEPKPEKTVQQLIGLIEQPHGDFTTSTAIRAALAVCLAQYTSSSESCFGAVVSGRQIVESEIERMAGPTIATVPLRVPVDQDMTAYEFLHQVQMQTIDMGPFEHFGLQRIQRISAEARVACSFQTLLIVQPMQNWPTKDTVFQPCGSDVINGEHGNNERTTMNAFNTYALMIEAEEITPGQLLLHFHFDSSILDERQVNRMKLQFEHILRQLCASAHTHRRLRSIDWLGDIDRLEIMQWNATRPTAIATNVLEGVSEMSLSQPTAKAISAWDGDFTYGELSSLSSRLATALNEMGISRGSVVPIYTEKTKWMPVAILGVLKTGAATFMQSTATPIARLLATLSSTQIPVKLMLTTQELSKSIEGLPPTRCIQDIIESVHSDRIQDEAIDLSMNELAALLATSGSTGTPKVIAWSHQTLSANVWQFAESFLLNRDSRVLEYASYNFDVSLIEILATFLRGGRICVPSDRERYEPLVGLLKTFQCNTLCTTRSTINTIEASETQGLTTLIYAGESVSRKDIEAWKHVPNLFNWYGPAESSSTTFCHIDHMQWRSGEIGHCGSTSRCWITSPYNYEALLPIGAVGELLIEGSTVAEGYLANPTANEKSFVNCPGWFPHSARDDEPYQPKLYRTGDLAKYNSEGGLVYVSRTDGQVKLRGQRLVLEDVETHVTRYVTRSRELGGLSIVAELITPHDCSDTLLVVFIGHLEGLVKPTGAELEDTVAVLTEDIDDNLSGVLPSYMIPSAYVPAVIPTTSTGKTHRGRLRQMGSAMSKEQLTKVRRTANTIKVKPSTPEEKMLQKLWADTLRLPLSSISADDSFMRIGGDSIQAMRFASAARAQGLSISVADVFKHPKLKQLALLVKTMDMQNNEPVQIQPFALLDIDCSQADLTRDLAALCNIDSTLVQDSFPCTPLQEGLLAMTARSADAYVCRTCFEVEPHVDVKRLQQAWETTVAKVPMLRTRIVNHSSSGLVQVVLSENVKVEWNTASSLTAYIQDEQDRSRRHEIMSLGVPLLQLGLVEDQSRTYLMWTEHHAIYDGWSYSLVRNAVEEAYRDASTAIFPLSFLPFVQYSQTARKSLSHQKYWKQQFDDLNAPQFPALVNASQVPRCDSTVEHQIVDVRWNHDRFTLSTLIRTAWAVVMSMYTGSNDVVFGATALGRQLPITGIEKMAGPTIATVPVRILMREEDDMESFLDRVHSQASDMIPYEQMGLQNIRNVSKEAESACQFQTLLAIQPADLLDGPSDSQFVMKEYEAGSTGLDTFSTFALTLVCVLNAGSVEVRARFDSTILDQHTVCRMLQQHEKIMRQIATANLPALRLPDIDVTHDQDLDDIWARNKALPESIEQCVHVIIEDICHKRPEAPAICAWDGSLTYQQLNSMASDLAYQLSAAGIGAGDVVPLYFEKSLWVPIAMLAVMKTGAASVTLEVALPDDRLNAIVEQVGATRVLSSKNRHPQASGLVALQSLYIEDLLDHTANASGEDSTTKQATLPYVQPSWPLYVIFTSGTTGMPKGSIVTHQNFCSAATHQRPFYDFDETSRVLDFASYAFDVSWFNVLHTLTAGGCLCIPRDEDKMSDLRGYVERMNVNVLSITPTVARSMDNLDIPGLKTVLFGGEVLKRAECLKFRPETTIINIYGPSECTIVSTGSVFDPVSEEEPSIGHGLGTVAWVVHPVLTNILSPVGAVGELLIEGPLVGGGYINNPAKTKEAFIEDPSWLVRGCNGVPGRRGKLYKTGDLVRYRADGQLVCLGRKDTQIKIHGQRIELGDIEHHLRQIIPTDAAQVIVDVMPRENGEKTLTAFVCPSDSKDGTNINDKVKIMMSNIYQQLTERLPPAMVPRTYAAVPFIPATANGKIDRRTLLKMVTVDDLLPLAAAAIDVDQSPLTPTEESLRQMWATVLRITPDMLGSNITFMQAGGDSIKVMSLSTTIRRQWQVDIPISQLSSSTSTLRQMASRIDQACAGETPIVKLANRMDADINDLVRQLPSRHVGGHNNDPATKAGTRAAFLTGATGFLGTQILRYLLLSDIFEKVIVLVRASTESEGMDRIRKAAELNGSWEPSLASRIEIWGGDLSKEQLGLSPRQWSRLSGTSSSGDQIDTIVHNGAAVYWSADYDALRAVNVLSTLQLLQATLPSPSLQRFVYISGGSSSDTRAMSTTNAANRTGYEDTKYVSERLVLAAKGLESPTRGTFSIVKPAFIIGDSMKGVANSDDFLWRVVITAVRLQARPLESEQSWMDIADVRSISEIIIRQITSEDVTTFVSIREGLLVSAFWAAIEEQLSTKLNAITWEEWTELVQRDLACDQEQHPLWPVQHFLGDLGVTEEQRPSSLRQSADTIQAAVRKNIQYLNESRFLEPYAGDFVSKLGQGVKRTKF